MRFISPLSYICAHPFAIMALCNIVGDLGYLGFAFAAQGLVSMPKLGGALFTMAAHVILLAYGDDQAKHIAQEQGAVVRLMLELRAGSQKIVARLPHSVQRAISAKPVGIPFVMLTMNGVGLLIDAVRHGGAFSGLAQSILGMCIIMGCGAFALADFVKTQKTANLLLKIAPSVLLSASIANIGLVLATLNFFLMISTAVFLISNLVGFYTRIDKNAKNRV